MVGPVITIDVEEGHDEGGCLKDHEAWCEPAAHVR